MTKEEEKKGVGQNIAMCVSPTASNFFFALNIGMC